MQNNTRVQFLVFFLVLALVGGAGFAGGIVYNQLSFQPGVLPTLAAPTQPGPTLESPAAPATSGAAPTAPPDSPTLIPTTAPAQAQVKLPAGAPPEFQRLVEAYNTIQENYVGRSALGAEPLVDGAIRGMVESLGDTGHSSFMTAAEWQSENSSMSGSFEGIGAYVNNKNGQNFIVEPMEGSPAEKAGVHAGDVILKVNGEDVSSMPLQQVISRIKGPSGTQVTITFGDPVTGRERDLTITRAKIIIQNVTWSMVPGTTIADIKVAQFATGVTNQLKEILTTLKGQGVTGLILDLRNNPGGYLNEGVGIASQFLKSGTVLQEKDAQGNIRATPVRSGGLWTDLPLVVLVNGGSASASEIFAGAMQDYGRAPLIGDTTLGTGTVMLPFQQQNGSVLMLATQEWLTPKGHSFWHVGVSPDYKVTLDLNIPLLQPSVLKTLSADQLKANPDVQFQKALEYLQTGKVSPTKVP